VAWTPDVSLQAALDFLARNYAPSDATDVSALRNKLIELSDEDEGGFYAYHEEFVKTHADLIKAAHPPTNTECIEWIKKGITNTLVKNFMASNLFPLGQPTPNFEQVFAAIRNYLKILGDQDPYKTCKAGPTSKPLVAALASDGTPMRCTRCWRNGHHWSNCKKGITCSQCNTNLTGHKFCPKWQTHKEQATRWVPPHLLKAAQSVEKSDKQAQGQKRKADDAPAEPNPANPTPSPWKAFRLAMKDKKKKEE